MSKWEKEFNEFKGLEYKWDKINKLIKIITKLEKEYSDKSQGEGEGTGT